MVKTSLLMTMTLWLATSGCAQKQPSPSQRVPARDPAAATQSSTPTAPPMGGVSTSRLDACADRLHELSGLLLEYYGIHGQLPPSLADAAALAPKNGIELLRCPGSGKAYIYDPHGPLVTAGGKARIVVYDAVPAHNGQRWGIVIAEPTPAKPLSAEVKIVPESAVGPSGQ
jgi:hypothetical protein